MQTMPMPLDSLAGSPGALDEFRVTAPREIAEMLRRLVDGSVQLHLNAGDGSVYSTALWTVDADRRTIAFTADPDDAALQALLETDDAVAVGYLDNVKLQIDLNGAVLVRGARASVLNCDYPRELFRFLRRNAYRVRPILRSTPVATLRHTDIADMQLALRVLDVSIGGCAIFLPEDVPPMQPGVLLNRVRIDLDADTRFHANLRLRHVTSLGAESKGVRLGCEFANADGDALRALQRFIDQTQKRGKLLALD